jgi:signal transduction histidine kinase
MAAIQALWGFSTVIFPVTLAVSVLRYQLFDIDILINRTLVYGALTAAIMAVYVMAVGYFGNVLQQLDSVFIAFLVTGLVALLFQPLRERLQRFINRLMYGERDDPMSVLKKMGSHLEDMVRPDQALAGIVKTAAQALKLPQVAIVTTHNNQREISAQYGESSNEQIEIPMVYQGENIGYLEIAKRGSNEDFSAKEITLLENIARQASSTVASVRLMEDLKRSRQRLVTTREEERRRLRRDLHDGLGASLAALHLQTGAIKRAIENDPDLAAAMVEEVRSELHEAIADIRRVAYELRPPALDELGLAAALRAQAAQYNKLQVSGNGEIREGVAKDGYLDVRVEAPQVLPPLPAAVEVATYRIVQEALTNVLKHANARRCVVRLGLADEFCVEILDDGIGIPEYQSWGIGLTSMCERASELGGTCVIEPTADGGTRVFASFPILQEKSK